MTAWPKRVREGFRQLAREVVELDGDRDEAPDLSVMAREAHELLARTTERRRSVKRLASGPTKEERNAERALAWAGARVAAFIRAGRTETSVGEARCEYEDEKGRCGCSGTDPDHIFGGALREETEKHGAAAIQVLCRTHHRLKTASKPTRAFWLDQAEAHIERHGLRVMLPYLSRARALLKGKRRG